MGLCKAEETEKQLIMEMYTAAMGRKGCTWNDSYPNREILEGDFHRGDLFVWKNAENEVVGAISIDDDKVVEALPCWSDTLQPSAELARLVVREDSQNQGIARKMILSVMEILRQRSCKSVHYLVSGKNERAVRSYAQLHFHKKGEADLFDEHWLCYEKAL